MFKRCSGSERVRYSCRCKLRQNESLGAIDSCQGIVVDMSNMGDITEIDEENLTFTVQAGASVHNSMLY